MPWRTSPPFGPRFEQQITHNPLGTRLLRGRGERGLEGVIERSRHDEKLRDDRDLYDPLGGGYAR